MCNKITTKFSKCGHEEVHDISCIEMLDGATCDGKQEQPEVDDEKKCPDCRYYDNALLQIATDANLAPHKPTESSAPAYTGPKLYHIRRFRWKHCGHIRDEWTDEECFDPNEAYLEEEQQFGCYKCAEAHPNFLTRMRQEGKLDCDDPWGLSIMDPTNHPKFGITQSNAAAEASRAPSAPSGRTRPPAISVTRSPPTEDASLYSLSPPPGTTSFYADDSPTEPEEPDRHEPPPPPPHSGPSRSAPPPRAPHPPRSTRRSPAHMVPIAEDPDSDSDLDTTDDEADDLMRPAVLAMPSVAPPAFVSRMPHRGPRAPSPPPELDADSPLDEEEPLHKRPPKWSAAGDGERAVGRGVEVAEGEELTPEELEEARGLQLPRGCKVSRRMLQRKREEAGLARMRALIPEEQVVGPGGRGRK